MLNLVKQAKAQSKKAIANNGRSVKIVNTTQYPNENLQYKVGDGNECRVQFRWAGTTRPPLNKAGRPLPVISSFYSFPVGNCVLLKQTPEWSWGGAGCVWPAVSTQIYKTRKPVCGSDPGSSRPTLAKATTCGVTSYLKKLIPARFRIFPGLAQKLTTTDDLGKWNGGVKVSIGDTVKAQMNSKAGSGVESHLDDYNTYFPCRLEKWSRCEMTALKWARLPSMHNVADDPFAWTAAQNGTLNCLSSQQRTEFKVQGMDTKAFQAVLRKIVQSKADGIFEEKKKIFTATTHDGRRTIATKSGVKRLRRLSIEKALNRYKEKCTLTFPDEKWVATPDPNGMVCKTQKRCSCDVSNPTKTTKYSDLSKYSKVMQKATKAAITNQLQIPCSMEI